MGPMEGSLLIKAPERALGSPHLWVTFIWGPLKDSLALDVAQVLKADPALQRPTLQETQNLLFPLAFFLLP